MFFHNIMNFVYKIHVEDVGFMIDLGMSVCSVFFELYVSLIIIYTEVKKNRYIVKRANIFF